MSTGIVLRPIGGDPRDEAAREREQRITNLQSELAAERNRRRELEGELEDERREKARMAEGVKRLRTSLTPLYDSLRLLFGDMEELGAMGDVSAAEAPVASPKHSAVWDSWKAKLPSGEAKAIDALLLHGKLSTPQLRIHIGCATRTSQNIANSLKSKGLITGSGSGWTLKPL